MLDFGGRIMNNFIDDLKRKVVPIEEQQQEAILKLGDKIQIHAKVWTFNEKEKETSEISL